MARGLVQKKLTCVNMSAGTHKEHAVLVSQAERRESGGLEIFLLLVKSFFRNAELGGNSQI